MGANQKQDMDKAARTVSMSVVVDAGGLRSRTDSSGTLQYTSVPTYFTCNSNEVSETGKNECFSCCRSACIVDEFASGAQKGGATYSHCDTACYSFFVLPRNKLGGAWGKEKPLYLGCF